MLDANEVPRLAEPEKHLTHMVVGLATEMTVEGFRARVPPLNRHQGERKGNERGPLETGNLQ
jgi:hypothetical protein